MMAELCFTHTRTVAFGECDPARIFFAPRAVDYAVEAVEAWYDAVIGVSWTDLVHCHGLEANFLSVQCDYQRSLVAGQLIRLRVSVVELDASTFTLEAVAELGPGEPVFRARFALCFVEHAGRAAVAIPARYRERIHSYRLQCRDQFPVGGSESRAGRGTPGGGAHRLSAQKDGALPFTRKRRIRYGECGVSGTMYLPKLVECAVERVGEWYRSCLGVSWLEQCTRGRGTPFVGISCQCLRPMAAGQTITMVVTVPRLGKASIGYEVVGYDDRGVPCFASQMAACYISEDSGAPRAEPFPDHLRGRILAYQEACHRDSRSDN